MESLRCNLNMFIASLQLSDTSFEVRVMERTCEGDKMKKSLTRRVWTHGAVTEAP
jgi:hypothetical protein